MQFSKGHGTENTFIVLPDPDGTLDLTPSRVAALCDRNRGIGADGVLRVVRWAALAEGPMPADDVEWFMDYRNADGSVAEMCGNGVRVYATYLAHRGWLPGRRAAARHPRRDPHACTSRTTRSPSRWDRSGSRARPRRASTGSSSPASW